MLKSISLIPIMLFGFIQPLQASNQGGTKLLDLIDSCQIVGLSSKNGRARYGLRNLRSLEIKSISGNTVTFINIPEDERTGFRPRYLSLSLIESRQGENGQEFRISGKIFNSPEDSFVVSGFLAPIWYSPSDTMQVTVNNEYKYRGTATVTNITEYNQSTKNFGWDLAIPSTLSKNALCESGKDVYID
jgi:hypothetical protein